MFGPLLLCEADQRLVLEGGELQRQLSVREADKGPYLERTTKVGSYASNKLGLYDMHGNVWQWCADLYDPKETEVGASHRVFRGSCWDGRGTVCQAAGRGALKPSSRKFDLGLRLARVPSAPAGK